MGLLTWRNVIPGSDVLTSQTMQERARYLRFDVWGKYFVSI